MPLLDRNSQEGRLIKLDIGSKPSLTVGATLEDARSNNGVSRRQHVLPFSDQKPLINSKF